MWLLFIHLLVRKELVICNLHSGWVVLLWQLPLWLSCTNVTTPTLVELYSCDSLNSGWVVLMWQLPLWFSCTNVTVFLTSLCHSSLWYILSQKAWPLQPHSNWNVLMLPHFILHCVTTSFKKGYAIFNLIWLNCTNVATFQTICDTSSQKGPVHLQAIWLQMARSFQTVCDTSHC